MKIGVIHATISAVAPLTRTFAETDSSIEIINFVNEELLAHSNRVGGVDDWGMRNFLRLAMMAVESDVDGIIIACSMYSTFASDVQKLTEKPVIGIDDPLVREAATEGNRIGIIATNPSAGALEEKKILQEAAHRGKTIETFVEIRNDAAKAIKSGCIEEGNRMLKEAGEVLVKKNCDLIVLSQITMAGARDQMLDLGVTVLSSPRSGAQYMMDRLG